MTLFQNEIINDVFQLRNGIILYLKVNSEGEVNKFLKMFRRILDVR